MSAEASRWQTRADRLAASIVSAFYDPEANIFWDRHYASHRSHKVIAFYNFLPLLAGVPLDPVKGRQMLEQYVLSPKHFWGALPFPTLSFSDSYYSPTNYMRGPVWPGPTFLLLMTLWKNGFREQADAAATRFLTVVTKRDSIYENYNSATGEPLYGKRVELIAWNAGCVVDMFLKLYQVDAGLW